MRIERTDSVLTALFSEDGKDWLLVGQTDFRGCPMQIGVYAIGTIDRAVYHGAYPDGTASRFDSFDLWGDGQPSM